MRNFNHSLERGSWLPSSETIWDLISFLILALMSSSRLNHGIVTLIQQSHPGNILRYSAFQVRFWSLPSLFHCYSHVSRRSKNITLRTFSPNQMYWRRKPNEMRRMIGYRQTQEKALSNWVCIASFLCFYFTRVYAPLHPQKIKKIAIK